MEYNIYHLIYHLGAAPRQEAVVSTLSPERARDLLEKRLDTQLFHEEGRAKKVGFKVERVEGMFATSNKEMVLCPYMPDVLKDEIKAREKVLKERPEVAIE